MPRVCGLLLAASALVSGCVSTVDGTAIRAAGTAKPVPVLDEAALNRLLLSVGEVNGIMGSTQMQVTGDVDQMTDHSDSVSDRECLGAIYAAEDPVYADTGWTAVRDRVVREPGDDNEHWVEQTAVLYPAAQNAQAFFESSSQTWQRCANQSLGTNDGDFSWQMGDVDVDVTESGAPLLTQETEQEDSGGWQCQHALSVVSNATVEAWACGYRIGDEAAQIATAMVGKAG
ncbi:sensor domain-containing protein [Mycolicibacterium sp. 018/SC-01/001]|uniref:sensor domain-containing protein n=1 Tax=Mycolicibacterium sp. 018/SC-01/001 TaxID=2592069 RepID=UPI00117F423C|nr:sensor domain-containing protein [Mycolicibacterium sp. 018/SC-01/001]TRW88515.1 sensor domain-containing protein [Mycolicibacterium sp. 018/SC-01/001]